MFLSRCVGPYVALALFAAVSAGAVAAPPSFKIAQVYSNIDGSLQFIRLTESDGRNDQHHFAGLTLTSTHNGVTKTYTFPNDLATDKTAHLSIVVAASNYGKLPIVVGGTSYNDGAYNCCFVPDFASMPVRFIATDGATLDFAGVDQFTYSSLPTDGLRALNRDGSIVRATVPGHGRCYIGVGCRDEYDISQAYVFAIEYYNAALDHYFLSASAPDIDKLDSGPFQDWQRTGAMFYVAGTPNGYPGLAQPVCRFYIPPDQGDSHFLSASAQECAEVRNKFPAFMRETEAAFYVALPDPATGQCPLDLDLNGLDYLVPMYRLWNQRADSNHRYTTDVRIRAQMIERGYVAEGYGPMGVAMCVP